MPTDDGGAGPTGIDALALDLVRARDQLRGSELEIAFGAERVDAAVEVRARHPSRLKADAQRTVFEVPCRRETVVREGVRDSIESESGAPDRGKAGIRSSSGVGNVRRGNIVRRSNVETGNGRPALVLGEQV